MNVPDFLHPHVAEVIGMESLAAQRASLWATVLKLVPFRDGNQWCVYLQEGIAGFGDSPEEAMCKFDLAMQEKIKQPK